MRRLLACAAFALTLSNACAYGPIGHQIVGAIADHKLRGTPAGDKIAALLDGMTLEKASVVPDEIKGWDKKGVDDPTIFRYKSRPKIDGLLADFWRANPPTKDHSSPVPSHHWFHYTDVSILSGKKYSEVTAGRSKWDIVQMIPYCTAVLSGAKPEENERKITKPIAIILLAHFLGDIHQPLHVGAEFFNAEGKAVDPDKDKSALENQGGNTITLDLLTPPPKSGKRAPTKKFHGFWDLETVYMLLPALPEEMPKEERRAKNDEAEAELVKQFVKEEPKNWRMPKDMDVSGYAEAWANEILPVAREAYGRLEFIDVRAKPEEDGHTLAVGTAREKKSADGVSYVDWSSGVARKQLHKAGWRLADLLEKSIK